MLTLRNIDKSFGSRTLFSEANLVLNRGERVGLIGRNGYGKSTLLRMICRKDPPDGGEIALEKDCKVGILEQYFKFEGETTLLEAERALPLLDGAYKESFKAERVLEGLGFDEALRSTAPAKLSGGFQIRLNLAKLLLSEPDLLLLDEPTNYLDILSVRWLEQFLLDWKGGAIVVSHDRTFIDRVSTHIALIYRQGIRKTDGTTTALYQRIQEEEEIHERTRQNQAKERARQEDFIRQYRSKARQAARVQSRVKALAREEVIEKLESEDDLSFQFSYEPFTPKWIMQVRDLAFGYEKEDLFQNLTFSLPSNARLAIVGPNGKGKSTLLSILYGKLSSRSGTVDLHSASAVGYLGQSNIEHLSPELTVEEAILEVEENRNKTRARTIAGCMLFSGDAAEKKIKVLSGGEKTRVHLGRIIARKTNILFLDEPTNHLDFYASQALLRALECYQGAIVLVTHDEEFLSTVANRLVVFKGGTAQIFDGGYEDFLRREGWENEGGPSHGNAHPQENAQSTKPSLNKKELRKLRADLNNERSSTLNPLKKRIKNIEEEITEHEQAISVEEEELLAITQEGFNDRAAQLSRSLSTRKEKIETLFEELEEVTTDLDKREKEFQGRLNSLDQ